MEQLLNISVLVLNRNWQAIQTCSARRAVHMLTTGHAKVVQDDGVEKFETHDFSSWLEYSKLCPEEQMLRSINIAIRVPRIVVLSFYDKFPAQEVTFSRRNVFLRDGHICQYCQKEFPEHELNLDHVIPRKKVVSRIGETSLLHASNVIHARAISCRTRQTCFQEIPQ